jgi:hypothetical protein
MQYVITCYDASGGHVTLFNGNPLNIDTVTYGTLNERTFAVYDGVYDAARTLTEWLRQHDIYRDIKYRVVPADEVVREVAPPPTALTTYERI